MSIHADLFNLDAPRKVLEAGKQIDAAIDAKLSPPAELVIYVRDWVTRNRSNNRYGR